MDEASSSLDPVAKGRIEDLKEKYTVILVTNDMSQARRVSDYTNLIYNAKIVAGSEGTEFTGIENAEVKAFLGEPAQ